MITRGFLALVGLAYLLLAAWCAARPAETAHAVGSTLQPGSGQSEYFVVYGGLQLALGLMFLWPLLDRDVERFSLTLCLVIHACLVVMRSISFGLYGGIQPMTYGLSAVEWVILLGSAGCFFFRK